MSWLDRVNNIELKVVTGEGSEFFPLYKGATKEQGMNASVFDFNNIEGSLVRRGKVSSFKHPFAFHFQGADNLDESERFEIAAKDQRPWTITIAEYGDLLVQPIRISYDNKKDGVSIISGEYYETIPDTFPDDSIDVQARVLDLVNIASISASEGFAAVGIPEPTLIATATASITEMGDKFSLAAITDFDLAAVQNAVNNALNAIDNIIDGPVAFMDRAGELARTPAKFAASVQDRIRTVKESYEDLKQSVNGLLTIQNKQYFESLGGILTATLSECSVIQSDEIADEQGIEENTIIDYRTRANVIETADAISDNLDDYLNTLGEMQSEVDASPDSFTPQVETISAVKNANNSSTGQLLQIAVGSLQERIYIVPDDIAIIPLVHRLLGRTDNDTITNFVEANNILLNEYLQIPKGREIIFFV